MTTQIGRGPIIFGFWLLGYALGFILYLVRVPIVSSIVYLFGAANATIVGAAISGLAGSLFMLVILFVWSHMGSSN
jgi:riboflavin transporter FmnP